MIRSILVPLDGSSYGERAVPLASDLARRMGATLHLVHVHSDVVIATAMESLTFIGSEALEYSGDDERAYLRDLAKSLGSDIRVETEVLVGARDDMLADYARENTDLVVACTHAHDGLMRFWHRSLGERLVKELGIPAILLRADFSAPARPNESEIGHILVPLSGMPEAEEVLATAVPLARATGASLTLVRVLRPTGTVRPSRASVPHGNSLEDEQVRRAQAYLCTIAERLRSAGLRVATRVEVADDPGRAIQAMTRTPMAGLPPVDLVALATHGHPALRRALTPSVSDSLIHGSSVPVLLCSAEHLAVAELSDPAGSSRGELAM